MDKRIRVKAAFLGAPLNKLDEIIIGNEIYKKNAYRTVDVSLEVANIMKDGMKKGWFYVEELGSCAVDEDDKIVTWNPKPIKKATEKVEDMTVESAEVVTTEEPVAEEPVAEDSVVEFTDDNDNVQSGEENSVEESVFETSNNNSILRWILSGVAVLLLILGAAYGGYLYGRYELSEEIAYKQMKADLKTAEITTKKAQVAIKKDSVAQEVDATKIGAMSIDNKDESANDEAKTETAKTSSDKYEDMDIRVRTGAYRIIGEDRTVKAKAGQTVEDIATKLLGPGMSCYVEVYNGLDGKATLKEGQTIKIPKLELKKRR